MSLLKRTGILLISVLLPSTVSSSELPFMLAGPTGSATGSYNNMPEVPAIFRNVTGIIDGQFSRPNLPPLRLTKDGRLGVSSQNFGKMPALMLLRPETVNKPFITSNRGAVPLVNSNNPFLKISPASLGAPEGFQHLTLCEPDPEESGVRANPYACGVSGTDDCYDVTLVGGVNEVALISDSTPDPVTGINGSSTNNALLSAPLTVRVSNPKTASAKIEEVTIHREGIRRNDKTLSAQFEHITPADGRLLVVRLGGQKLTWFNENTGRYQTGNVDTAYSVAPAGANTCDASNWKKFYPISHAPYHAAVRDKYKFAKLPFRDPMGNLIPDGADIKGSYPWIDHKARMMSLTVFNSRLNDHNGNSRYPTRCVVDGCSLSDRKDVTDSVHDIGYSLFGLWTRGKMVVLDGVINDIDFKLGQQNINHSYAQLYAPYTGIRGDESGEVRMGSTRGFSEIEPVGTVNNGSIFDSIEERLNFLPNLRPVGSHDVNWLVSSGRQTDELPFDDYLRPSGFIVSEMTGTLDHGAGNAFQMQYHDGWDLKTLSFSAPVYLQNSATTLPSEWHIPTHGEVKGGRLEPAALGGVRGKGLWLDGGASRLVYNIKTQPRNVDAFPWHIGLFIEPRMAVDGEVTLVRFPDNTSINLLNRNTVIYRNASGVSVSETRLPVSLANKAWAHLGFQVFTGGRRVQLLFNGLVLDEWKGAANTLGLFRLVPGQLVLGAPATAQQKAFRGWIDDFKIFSEVFNPEVSCNMANGTLIGLPDSYTGIWRSKAGFYPASSHNGISKTLQMNGQTTYPRYACYADHSGDYVAHKRNLPNGTFAIREAVNFPEGPLFHDAPRPDSEYNPFCLGCHTADGQGGLDLTALKFRDITGKFDPRRQPFQPGARVWGNFPASWIANAPSWPFKTGDSGLLIDELMLPSSIGQKAAVKALVLVDARTGLDIMPLTNGMILNLSALEPDKLNVRASSTGLTRRVEFVFDGAASYQEPPFALFGTNETTAEADFAFGNLVAGTHTLSAKPEGGSEMMQITFTVMGAPIALNQPTTSVILAVFNEQRDLLGAFTNEVQGFFSSIFGFFNGLASHISALFDRLFTTQDVALGDTSAGFSRANTDLQLFVDFSVLDKHRGVIEMRGRAYGSHGNKLYVNGVVVPIMAHKWTLSNTNLAVTEYALSIRNAASVEEKTWINFNEAKVPAGLVMRQDARALAANFLSRLDVSQITAKLNEFGGFDIIDVNGLGSLKVDSLAFNGLSITESATNLPSSDVQAVIPAQLKLNQVAVNSTATIRTGCLFGRCLFDFSMPINFSLNNAKADVQLGLTPPPADKNQIFAAIIKVQLDSSSYSFSFLPQPNESTFRGMIRSTVRSIVAAKLSAYISKKLESVVNTNVSRAREDALYSIPINTPVNTWVADNLGSVLPLLPKGLTDVFGAFQEAGVHFTLRVTNARTQANDFLLALDGVANNSTLDTRVIYGQRMTDSQRSKALSQTASSVYSERGDSNYLHVNSRFSSALLAGLTQSNTFDEAIDIDLMQFLDLKVLKDAVQSGSAGSDPALTAALNTMLTNINAQKAASGVKTGLNARLRVEIENSPYLLDSANPAVNRVRIDDVAVTLESIPTARAQIEGLKPATLMTARFGVILTMKGDVIGVEALRIHELSSSGVVMTPASMNTLLRGLVNRVLADRAPRGFLMVKKAV